MPIIKENPYECNRFLGTSRCSKKIPQKCPLFQGREAKMECKNFFRKKYSVSYGEHLLLNKKSGKCFIYTSSQEKEEIAKTFPHFTII